MMKKINHPRQHPPPKKWEVVHIETLRTWQGETALKTANWNGENRKNYVYKWGVNSPGIHQLYMVLNILSVLRICILLCWLGSIVNRNPQIDTCLLTIWVGFYLSILLEVAIVTRFPANNGNQFPQITMVYYPINLVECTMGTYNFLSIE
jgi:hypothetical protein